MKRTEDDETATVISTETATTTVYGSFLFPHIASDLLETKKSCTTFVAEAHPTSDQVLVPLSTGVKGISYSPKATLVSPRPTLTLTPRPQQSSDMQLSEFSAITARPLPEFSAVTARPWQTAAMPAKLMLSPTPGTATQSSDTITSSAGTTLALVGSLLQLTAVAVFLYTNFVL